MTQHTDRQCRQCRVRFQILPEELSYYQRINVPPPTHCRDCRVQRRMTWRNDRTFYVRKSDFSGKQMISIYPAGAPFPVYHPSEWYSDLWDPLKYGRELNLNRSFFEQWHELMLSVPRLGIDIVNCENSDYCNYCGDDKNCYLDIAGEANQECFYNLFTKYSRDCLDCTFVYNSELCYQAINCYRCYNVRHSMYIEDSSDCAFSFDLKGCHNCLFCSNLRNKEYYVHNKPYSKSDYLSKVSELILDTHSGVQAALAIWRDQVIAQAVHRDAYALNSENCSGNDIKSSRNCHYVFNISDCEDSRYLYYVLEAKDCYDLNYSLYKPELSYELISTLGMKCCAFSMASHYCSEVFYCDQCNNSSYLFGCIGLNRKEYCILNKQYSRADYINLRQRLMEQMQAAGEWGQFFPAALSPFGYNETVADEYFPLNQSDALKAGFRWKEKEQRGSFDGPKLTLPDRVSDTEDSVIRSVLTCEVSAKPYKIIAPELQFYKKMGIPLPRRAPDQRHRERLALRNMRNLWNGRCDGCGSAISTSYSPNSPYRIFCEKCYLQATD